jgi:hypothetical protein
MTSGRSQATMYFGRLAFDRARGVVGALLLGSTATAHPGRPIVLALVEVKKTLYLSCVTLLIVVVIIAALEVYVIPDS